MENSSLDETRPAPVIGEAGKTGEIPPGFDQAQIDKPTNLWKWLALVGLITLVIIAAMSAYGGYRSGMNMRTGAKATAVAQEVERQFDMGMQEFETGQYDLARQRFEWVIQQDPEYPKATDMLAKVMVLLNTTATPTQAPTPTLTPTPDLRSIEELYQQTLQFMAASDWNNAIDALLKMRKDAPDFHTIEVDDLLFVALRSRGIDKIKGADLEGGTYDLAQAEQFGPLDIEAKNYRDWAELYITGASFWDVDWPRVIDIFRTLWQIVPYLQDASGWTVTDRLRIGLMRYGDQLALAGEWCQAQAQYEASLEITADPTLQPTAAHAIDQCERKREHGGRATATSETPPEEATPTESLPSGPPPEATQTPTPTPTPESYP
jgi:tetratricopeptide (TPR) repeat protein